METEGSIFVIEDVSYSRALQNVTLNLSRNQLIGLVGPNGAGKSTLIRLLAGIWRPSKGNIYLNGRALRSMSPRRRAKDIAYLPQHIPETDTFTVEQYVEMGRYPYSNGWGGLSHDSREAVDQAISSLSLSPLRDVYLSQLSGGERQRAGIARCLAQGSPIILLDEPIASLDVHYQLDILIRLRELAEQGYLIVVAIHHLELAARFCHSLILLTEGQVHGMGTPEEVLTEESIQEVFQVPAKTYADPYGGFLRVTHL